MKYLIITLLLLCSSIVWGECYHNSVRNIILKYKCLECGEWVSELDLMKQDNKFNGNEPYTKQSNFKTTDTLEMRFENGVRVK